jgi:pyruvate formate lyase activating enzyme
MLDHKDAIKRFVELIVTHADYSTPWHLMRFFPSYLRNREPVGDIDRLRQMREHALMAGLEFVYISNVPNIPETNTYCPNCGTTLAKRTSDAIPHLPFRCPRCHQYIPGVGLY